MKRLLIAASLAVLAMPAYGAIKDYSTTPASNVSLFPEGMNPAAVNNGMRQVQADIRSFYEAIEFRDFGHVPTYVDTNTLTVSGDKTGTYKVGQRVKLYGSIMGTLYGTISAASYSAPNTTIDITMDSGSLTSNLSTISAGIDPDNDPIPFAAVKGAGALAQKDAIDSSVYLSSGVVTLSKIEDISNLKVLGNVSGSNSAPSQVAILDEDTMSSNSATSLATQQSIKAYVDTNISSFQVGTSLYQSVGTSVPASTWTELLFDTEAYDDSNWHSTSSNTGRTTVDFTGRAVVIGFYNTGSNANGIYGIRFLKNGTVIKELMTDTGAALTIKSFSLSDEFAIASGDYIQMQVYASGGGTVTSGTGVSGTSFKLRRVK